MLGLSNPDHRRALRALVDAIAILALVVLLYVLTGKLSGNPDGLVTIARGALIIVGLGTLFYGAENVTRAIKLTAPGFSADIAGDAPAAAQTVADAAKTKADQISDAAVVQNTEQAK